MNEALKEFLIDNFNEYHIPFGINALAVYYKLNDDMKVVHQKDTRYNFRFKKNQIARSSTSQQSDLSQFLQFTLPDKEF